MNKNVLPIRLITFTFGKERGYKTKDVAILIDFSDALLVCCFTSLRSTDRKIVYFVWIGVCGGDLQKSYTALGSVLAAGTRTLLFAREGTHTSEQDCYVPVVDPNTI